ncbi:MAG: hypothetical protein QM770_16785 [Tepidisphaeraceae bacterium]
MTKKERVANLVVITFLLAGGMVGGTKLFLKKLHQPAEYTFPPEVVRRWAFMDPTPGAYPELPRFTPARTGAWVAGEVSRLALTPGLKSLLGDGDFRAVMSDHLNFQLAALDESNGNRRVGLVAWNRNYKDIKQSFQITGLADDGSRVPGEIEGLVGLAVPLDIRSELQGVNYVNPLDLAVWIQVRFSGDRPIRSLELTYTGMNLTTSDKLALNRGESTHPATTQAVFKAPH